MDPEPVKKSDASDTQSLCEKLMAKNEALEERLAESGSLLARVRDRFKAQSDTIAQLRSENASLADQLLERDRQVEALQAALKGNEQELGVDMALIEKLHRKMASKKRTIGGLRDRIHEWEKEEIELRGRIEALEREGRWREEAAQAFTAALQTQLAEAKGQIQALRAERREREDDAGHLRRKVERLETAVLGRKDEGPVSYPEAHPRTTPVRSPTFKGFDEREEGVRDFDRTYQTIPQPMWEGDPHSSKYMRG